MKPAELRDQCREDYGVLGHTLREIARRRVVSERTLQNWRKQDSGTERDWDTLRERLVKADAILSEELLQLATVTARRIRETIENGADPESSKLYALKRILDSANAARRAEQNAAPPAPEPEKDKRTAAQKMQATLDVVQKGMGLSPKRET